MTATNLLRVLRKHHVRLTVIRSRGDVRLRVEAPPGALDEELRSALLRHKLALVDLLEPATRFVLVDFETRSLARLEEVGGRAYAGHPSTQAICLVARLPDRSEVVWRTGEGPPRPLLVEAARGAVFVAHNADAFDRHVWDSLGWAPVRWLDSMALCWSTSITFTH